MPPGKTNGARSRRVGLILPSVNATVEPEFNDAAPAGFTFHSTRVTLHATTTSGLRSMNLELEGAARLMASFRPDLVVYACTSGSFVDGFEAMNRQTDCIGALAGCPVLSTSQALVSALTAVGATRVALGTPYVEPVAALERAFLEEAGWSVVGEHHLELSGTQIREVPLRQVLSLAKDVDSPDADAVVISCTDLGTIPALTELELDLDKPVLTSNQVTLWAILRHFQWPDPVPWLGRLGRSIGVAS